MRIIWNRDRYEFVDVFARECYTHRQELRNIGGQWDYLDKTWWAFPSASLEKLRSLHPTISPEALEKFQSHARQQAENIKASRATDAVGNFPKPKGLEYLAYQRSGIAYALARRDTYFGDEMGLGKSVQSVGVINIDPSANRILIICPATLKLNWKKEFTKWDTKGLSCEIITPKTKKFPAVGATIINYELMTKWQSDLRTFEWHVLIVDEVHSLKNPSALRTQEIFGRRRIVKEILDEATGEIELKVRLPLTPISAKRRLFLSGTPIVNRPSDLWTIVHALDPDDLGKNKRKYEERFCAGRLKKRCCCVEECDHGRVWDASGASNLEDLQKILRSKFMIRRLKKDVLAELPPKRRQVLVLASTPALDKILEKEKQTYEKYAKALREGKFETPEFAEMSRVRKEVAIAKIPFILEYVQETLKEVDKICLFLHHYEVVDALGEAFGDASVTVDGRTSNEDRQIAVDRFQTDSACKVFIGTIKAAGIGITLTASSNVVFGEFSWTPSDMNQAEDRCHRIGQKDSVFVCYLALENSLDERQAQLIIQKQDVIDRGLDEVKTQT